MVTMEKTTLKEIVNDVMKKVSPEKRSGFFPESEIKTGKNYFKNLDFFGVEEILDDKSEVTEEWIREHLPELAKRAGFTVVQKRSKALRMRRVIR